MKGLSFQYLKNIITKLRNRTASESMCLVMNKGNHSPFTFLKSIRRSNEPITDHKE